MNIKSRQIKETLIELAVNDELPLDLNELDASIFDVVFDEDEPTRLYAELGKYLSNDGDDYDGILADLRVAKNERPNDSLENLSDEINVWDKVEGSFSIKEFCNLINL